MAGWGWEVMLKAIAMEKFEDRTVGVIRIWEVGAIVKPLTLQEQAPEHAAE